MQARARRLNTYDEECSADRCFVLVKSGLDAAVLHGRVLDGQSRPVEGATVSLGKSLTTRTNTQGKYRFENLAESTYSVHAESAGIGTASSGSFSLRADENKNLDLTLPAAPPEFFDEPKFVVAGVMVGAYQGGHGSDVVLRSAESLAKATDGLRAGLPSAPSNRDADRHHSLADADESAGDWGAELLRHHADSQAVEIFTKATVKYPGSVRTLLGLATAYYARGSR